MFRKVGLLAHIVLHPPQQFGYFDHCHFYFEDELVMSGSGHSDINENIVGLTSASPPINIPSKLGASGHRLSIDSGVGTSTPDITIDAGSASSSPFQSVGTQTPARSLFDMAFVLKTSWERDLSAGAIAVNPGTGKLVLMFDGHFRSLSLPENMITASELEALEAAGRELRFIADEYGQNAEERRRTIETERARSKSLLERLLRL